MKWLIGIVVLGLGATGIYYWINNKIALTTQANINIKSTNIELGVLTTKFIFSVDVVNPSNAAEQINSFTADVVYNNVAIGKINYLKSISVAPASTTNISVEMDASNIDLIKNFPALLTSSFSGIVLLLDGFINTAAGAIPFTKATTIL
jgi:LEA14-like dessication related protein